MKLLVDKHKVPLSVISSSCILVGNSINNNFESDADVSKGPILSLKWSKFDPDVTDNQTVTTVERSTQTAETHYRKDVPQERFAFDGYHVWHSDRQGQEKVKF